MLTAAFMESYVDTDEMMKREIVCVAEVKGIVAFHQLQVLCKCIDIGGYQFSELVIKAEYLLAKIRHN